MCGIKSKLLLLGLVFLLSACLYSQDYDGPSLPPGWYPIHQTELTELQTIFSEQRTELTLLRIDLTESRQALTEAKQSLTAYAAEAKAARIKATLLGFGLGVGSGVILALILR